MPTENISPAKKVRSLRRLLAFKLRNCNTPEKSVVKRFPVLSICPQVQSSFLPTKPHIEISIQPSISIKPKTPKLSTCPVKSISIPGRRIFNPAILQACQSMFGKHPDLLDQNKIMKFNHYIQYKIEEGDPIESSIIYTPAGGAKKCLQCGELT